MSVMPGLDPGIHGKARAVSTMDSRVKPANDAVWLKQMLACCATPS
jgi:hypothetical protein